MPATEWSSSREGYEGKYAREDGIQVPACPICNGVKPDDEYAHLFKKKQRGHRKDCLYGRKDMP